MSQSILRRTVWSLVIMAAVVPLCAHGAIINVILSDVDVTYSGSAAGGAGSIYDTIGHPGGNLNPAEADDVATAVFELDMVLVGTMVSTPGNRSYADLRIDGVGSAIVLGPLHTGIGSNGGGFGFDWFSDGGQSLRLGIDTIDLRLTQDVLQFSGMATLLSQDMPFGLEFDPAHPVVFSYTATLPTIIGLAGAPAATGAMASGALTISGRQIPEPAGGTVLLVGGMLVTVMGRRLGGRFISTRA